MPYPCLDIQNLAVGYNTLTVTHGINFTLPEGKLCAIVGVNGIGKSTLLRTLAALQPQLSGEIRINGEALAKYTPIELARKLAVVLTQPIATKNLTVKELIALGRQPHTNWWGTLTQKDIARVSDSLRVFSLDEIADKKCFELSDGQLQRVLIARAQAQDTPIILLDEPTTHLDLSHKVEIFKRLQQLAHEHTKTILFTTHEIELAIQLCDSMLLLDGRNNPFGEPGTLIAEGHFERLFPSESVQFDAATGTFKVKK